MTTIDFNSELYKDPTHFTCNGKKITQQSTIDNLLLNCKNAKVIEHSEPAPNDSSLSHNPVGGAAIAYNNSSNSSNFTIDIVKFWDDKNSYMTCQFFNGQLKKCKYKLAEINKPTTSTPTNANLAESTTNN